MHITNRDILAYTLNIGTFSNRRQFILIVLVCTQSLNHQDIILTQLSRSICVKRREIKIIDNDSSLV